MRGEQRDKLSLRIKLLYSTGDLSVSGLGGGDRQDVGRCQRPSLWPHL